MIDRQPRHPARLRHPIDEPRTSRLWPLRYVLEPVGRPAGVYRVTGPRRPSHDRTRHAARRGRRAPRSPACRTSSRPTTRRPTSRGWWRRRSRRCRRSPRRSRSSPSTTARGTGPREIADRLAAEHPGVVRAVHHEVNRGYGGALRSGFEASRYELLVFTDGDRQFRVADIARLTARLAEADHPDVVVGYRIKRADPFIRIVYARTYKLANRIFFGLRVRDVDCACKLFRREALEGVRVESGGAFFSAELLIKIARAGPLDRRGRRAALPAHGRLADGREAVRDLACRQGLLDAAAAPVGERATARAPGQADPGRLSRRASPSWRSRRRGDRRPPASRCSRTRGRCRAAWGRGSPVASSEPAASRSGASRASSRAAAPSSSSSSSSSLVVGQRRRLVQHLRRGVDRALEPDRERDRVRRAGRPPRDGCRRRPAPAGRGTSRRRATR